VAELGGKKPHHVTSHGLLAAQVFAIAAETGWPEERILFIPLARLAPYQHCLLRRNGVRTSWGHSGDEEGDLREKLEALRGRWTGVTQFHLVN